MKYIRRLLWFIASRMIILSACVAILICAFYMALNSGNIYILVTDGMGCRVEVALTRGRKRTEQVFQRGFFE